MTILNDKSFSFSQQRRRLLSAMMWSGLAGLLACSPEKTDTASKLNRPPDPAPASNSALQARRDDSPELIASSLVLPGLIDSATQGPFIDLMRVLESALPQGTLKINIHSISRAHATLSDGTADFLFPAMRLRQEALAGKPFRYTDEFIGKVSFVIYSNSAKPLTREVFLAAARRGEPYLAEASPIDWGFPTKPFVDFETSFKKLSAGRIDCLIWAQE